MWKVNSFILTSIHSFQVGPRSAVQEAQHAWSRSRYSAECTSPRRRRVSGQPGTAHGPHSCHAVLCVTRRNISDPGVRARAPFPCTHWTRRRAAEQGRHLELDRRRQSAAKRVKGPGLQRAKREINYVVEIVPYLCDSNDF